MRMDKSRKMAIATATAKKAGFASFKAGSPGEKKREEIALAIERKLRKR